jgi:hypothetical protein
MRSVRRQLLRQTIAAGQGSVGRVALRQGAFIGVGVGSVFGTAHIGRPQHMRPSEAEEATSIISTRQPSEPSEKIPLLRPLLPTVAMLEPYLREIDENRWYTNFGPLAARLPGEVAVRVTRTGPGTVPALGVVATTPAHLRDGNSSWGSDTQWT